MLWTEIYFSVVDGGLCVGELCVVDGNYVLWTGNFVLWTGNSVLWTGTLCCGRGTLCCGRGYTAVLKTFSSLNTVASSFLRRLK